jgi:hypothetical protein
MSYIKMDFHYQKKGGQVDAIRDAYGEKNINDYISTCLFS